MFANFLFSNDLIALAYIVVCFLVGIILPGFLLNKVIFGNQFTPIVGFAVSFSIGIVLQILFGVLWLLMIGRTLNFFTPLTPLVVSILIYISQYLLRKNAGFYLRHLNYRPVIVIVLVFLMGVIVSSFIYSFIGKNEKGFTEFALLADQGFPTILNIRVKKDHVVRLSIKSYETTAMTYSISMRIDDKVLDTHGPFVLQPQQEKIIDMEVHGEDILTKKSGRIIFDLQINGSSSQKLFITYINQMP